MKPVSIKLKPVSIKPMALIYEGNLNGGRRVILNGQDISGNVVKDGVSIEYSDHPTRQCAVVTLRVVVDDLTVRSAQASFHKAATDGDADYEVSEETARALDTYRSRHACDGTCGGAR